VDKGLTAAAVAGIVGIQAMSEAQRLWTHAVDGDAWGSQRAVVMTKPTFSGVGHQATASCRRATIETVRHGR
jgi:hypothetical protein